MVILQSVCNFGVSKMGILLICSYVSPIEWLHHLDFNETHGEQVR